MTQPANHKVKCEQVKATWGKRCDILLFMSTQEGNSLTSYFEGFDDNFFIRKLT